MRGTSSSSAFTSRLAASHRSSALAYSTGRECRSWMIVNEPSGSHETPVDAGIIRFSIRYLLAESGTAMCSESSPYHRTNYSASVQAP
jgi:hypothetical protein